MRDRTEALADSVARHQQQRPRTREAPRSRTVRGAAGADVGVDPARIETFDTVDDAVARARTVTDDDAQIVVTGSLYTVGAARHALVHGE